MKLESKRRILSLDIIRIVSIFLIFNYHFGITNQMPNSIICGYRNGDWGCVGTTMFFVLSGYVLYLHYPLVKDLKSFYYKRFLAIFPMFYITFLGAYLFHSVMERNFLYGGHPAKLLLTLIGFDKYALFFGVSSYQIVGEWFTAIIVILYLIYPLLVRCFEKSEVITTLVVCTLYGLNMYFEFLGITAEASIFTGLLMFYIGMLLNKYGEKIKANKWITLVSFAIILVFMAVPLAGNSLLLKNIFGICLFLFLFTVCSKEIAADGIKKGIVFLSQISYGVYLSHHFIMNSFYAKFGVFFQTKGLRIISYGIVLVFTIITAYALNVLNHMLLKKKK